MPLAKVNWDDAAKAELIPDGRYTARIDKVELRTSRQENAEEYWNVTFTIQDEEHLGRKLWSVFMLSPNALWKLRQLYEALAIDVLGEMDLNSDDLLGQEVGVIVGTEEYAGKVRNKVSGFFKA